MRNAKGQFVKGEGFWTGKKRPGLKTKSQFVKGSEPYNKGKLSPETSNELNGLWKGDEAGYGALHAWVSRKLGKPNLCEHCGLDKIPTGFKRYFNWANISGEYHRNLEDWIRLCRPCHIKYDRESGIWGNATKLWKK